MAKVDTSIRRIERLERLNNSRNGNPRYRVHFTDGSSAITTSDAGFCYGIENRELRDNDVTVTWTPAGRIGGLEPIIIGTETQEEYNAVLHHVNLNN